MTFQTKNIVNLSNVLVIALIAASPFIEITAGFTVLATGSPASNISFNTQPWFS